MWFRNTFNSTGLMSDIVIRLWNKRKLCQVIFMSLTQASIRSSVLSLSLMSSRASPTNIPSMTAIEEEERIIFCRYLTNDGTTGILDIFVYDTHTIAECIAIRPASPQPNRAIVFSFRSDSFNTLTPSYQSSCNSPSPQVEVPKKEELRILLPCRHSFC